MKRICTTLLLAITMVGAAEAKTPTKHRKKSSKQNFTLIEAYTQRTLSGMKSPAPPPTDNHFIILWTGASYPETFFWRGESGFLTCNIQRVHKVSGKDARNFPPGIVYRADNAIGDQVQKGDTLELTPLTRGKYAIPADIPKTAKNTLFYKTGGSGWLSFPVKNMSKKHDISMP